jgi:hypothetical protein
MPKRLWLLIKLDIKIHISSVWLYLLLALTALTITIFYFSQPENRYVRIAVVDKPGTPQSHRLLQKMRDRGYHVKTTPTLPPALVALENENLAAVIHITSAGVINWYTASPMLSDRKKKVFRSIVNAQKKDLFDEIAQHANINTLQTTIVQDDLTHGRSLRQQGTLVIAIKIMWNLSAVWSLIMLLTLKNSFQRLLRKYSPTEIFFSKVFSGLIFGAILAVVCWLTIAALGVDYPCRGPVIFCSLGAVLAGTLFGLMVAGIPLLFRTTSETMILVGMMLIFIAFTVMGDGSGGYKALPTMSPLAQSFAPWNQLYLLNSLASWSFFKGLSGNHLWRQTGHLYGIILLQGLIGLMIFKKN